MAISAEREFWRLFEAPFERRACVLYGDAQDQVRRNGQITRVTLASMNRLSLEADEAGAQITAAELRQTGAAAEMGFPFRATTYLTARTKPRF